MAQDKLSKIIMDEQLSALLDNELDAKASKRVLQRVCNEPSLQAAWSRQHLLKAVLAGEDRVLPDADFAARVMAELFDTPAKAEPAKVIALPTRPRRFGVWAASGLAMAASVVGVMLVLKVMPVQTPTDQMTLAAANMQTASEQADVRKVATDAEIQREMEEYLLEHQRLAARHGLATPRGYMRMATPGFTHVSYSGE